MKKLLCLALHSSRSTNVSPPFCSIVCVNKIVYLLVGAQNMTHTQSLIAVRSICWGLTRGQQTQVMSQKLFSTRKKRPQRDTTTRTHMLLCAQILSCDASGIEPHGRISSGTRASTEKKKSKGKQAAAATAAQELEALHAR